VKANEAKLNIGACTCVGSVSFTTPTPPCLLYNHLLKVKPTSIPISGGTGPSMNALIGGQVDIHVRTDHQRGSAKSRAAPSRPTRSRRTSARSIDAQCADDERGRLPRVSGIGLNARLRPKTRRKRCAKASAALDKALDDDAPANGFWNWAAISQARHRGAGIASCTALVKNEIAKWTPVIKAAGRPTDLWRPGKKRA